MLSNQGIQAPKLKAASAAAVVRFNLERVIVVYTIIVTT